MNKIIHKECNTVTKSKTRNTRLCSRFKLTIMKWIDSSSSDIISLYIVIAKAEREMIGNDKNIDACNIYRIDAFSRRAEHTHLPSWLLNFPPRLSESSISPVSSEWFGLPTPPSHPSTVFLAAAKAMFLAASSLAHKGAKNLLTISTSSSFVEVPLPEELFGSLYISSYFSFLILLVCVCVFIFYIYIYVYECVSLSFSIFLYGLRLHTTYAIHKFVRRDSSNDKREAFGI